MQQNFEKLPVYQEALKLVSLIYIATKQFPKEEIYGLSSQIRRAAVSVPLNIAEGQGRKTKKDHRQFLFVARGSIYEIIAILQITLEQKILIKEDFNLIRRQIEILLPQINGMIRYLEN